MSNILKCLLTIYSDIKDWYDYVTSDGELRRTGQTLSDDDKLNDDNHYLTKSHCATNRIRPVELVEVRKLHILIIILVLVKTIFIYK